MPDRMREERARARRTPDQTQPDRSDPGVAGILRLQRSIGNAGVGRLLSRQPAPQQAAQRFGLDWSVAHPPSDKSLASAGVSFACRYLSHSPGKNLKLLEANHLSSIGIDLVVVWETTANRALAGHDAGVADATEAQRQANHLGMPDDRPIYFAIDFDATAHQLQHEITEYFQGVNEVLGAERTGVYGGFRQVGAMFDAGLVTFGLADVRLVGRAMGRARSDPAVPKRPVRRRRQRRLRPGDRKRLRPVVDPGRRLPRARPECGDCGGVTHSFYKALCDQLYS